METDSNMKKGYITDSSQPVLCLSVTASDLNQYGATRFDTEKDRTALQKKIKCAIACWVGTDKHGLLKWGNFQHGVAVDWDNRQIWIGEKRSDAAIDNRWVDSEVDGRAKFDVRVMINLKFGVIRRFDNSIKVSSASWGSTGHPRDCIRRPGDAVERLRVSIGLECSINLDGHRVIF